MSFLPICIETSGRRLLFAGGGRVALQKITLILPYLDSPSQITVVAPAILDEIRALGVCCIDRQFTPGDCSGYALVYACTDISSVNLSVREDAHASGALACIADAPAVCDFVSPAIFRFDDMSIAVSSNGRNASRSVRVRNTIRSLFENDSSLGN